MSEARRISAALLCAALWADLRAQEVDLNQLSLQRLLDIDVTSVSKRSQKLQDVATSIYVITEEDIRRSGATRIQDVLKMAPGVWFEDASYNVSASAIREGAFAFQQTLLWLVDGVPIVNPTTGGVYFGLMDFPLSDIQRIEIIKGPGGTIYGANAAAGIISVFTKNGEASDGMRASMDLGTQRYLSPYFRYGFEPGENLFLTLWGKAKTHAGYDRNPLFSGDQLMAPQDGFPSMEVDNHFRGEDDQQQALSGGLKWNYRPSEDWTWSGWAQQNHISYGQYAVQRYEYSRTPSPTLRKDPEYYPSRETTNQILADLRLDGSFGEKHTAFLNVYHWHHEYAMMMGHGFNQDFDQSEVELQDNLEWGRHRLSSGADARRVKWALSGLDSSGTVFFARPNRQAFLFSAFLQDEVDLGNRLRLTLGSKAETWTLLGLAPELSPNLRLAWTPTPEMTFWGAASRSITTPSYSQVDMEYWQEQIPPAWVYALDTRPNAPKAPRTAGDWIAIVSGDPKPTEYYTVELGHRGSRGPRLQWDGSLFYCRVKDATSLTALDTSLEVPSKTHPGDSVTPLYNTNLLDRDNFGGEFLARVMPWDNLRLEASYSLFWTWNLHGLPIPNDPQHRDWVPTESQTRTPHHVGRLKAYLDLPWEMAFTTHAILSSPFSRGVPFNYVTQSQDPRGGVTADPPSVQLQLDLTLQKRFFRDRLNATVWGRNLLADPFVETYNQYGWISYPHQVHRTFGAGLDYRF